jgi:hypothetical protein
MAMIEATCAACGSGLEFPGDLERVSCAGCGAEYKVLRFRGAVTLARTGARDSDSPAPHRAGLDHATSATGAIDEAILDLEEAIEELRSKERARPLEIGCALFGIFGLVIVVFAIFATVARRYFGGLLFYAVLILVILAGLARARRKITSAGQREQLLEHRRELELQLEMLRREKNG